MKIVQGIKVSPGVAIGRALVLDAEDQPIPRRTIARAKVAEEQERLKTALAASLKEIEDLRKVASQRVGAELARIFDVHALMIQDKHLVHQCMETIRNDEVTAEFAVYSVVRRQLKLFEQIEDRYLRDRSNDLLDLERRIIGNLVGRTRRNLSDLSEDVVLVAHDLTPSQTAGLDKAHVKGIATDAGGQTSHTAILAHAQGIPAVVGLESIAGEVSDGQTVIVDGNKGLLIIDPDAAELLEYREKAQRLAEIEVEFDEAASLPAVMKDGVEVTVWANIEFPDEVPAALAKGATGIGLFRTEFLYLASDQPPDEEQQYRAYHAAIKNLRGRPMTIRTLDLGADKTPGMVLGQPVNEEANPFLGCRSIRMCLQNLPLFKTQLRAILRAAVGGNVRIMFPLISSIMELRQARMILSDVREDLEESGVEFNANIPVGIMIEVPSAALQAKALARESDFFSIGTNDLIQYTVAVDRGNERIANLYSGAHPAVLMLIRDVVRAAEKANVEVSLCGEMGGEPEFIPLLLGLGLRKLSMTPPAVPEVKKIIRSFTSEQCQRLARKAVTFDSDREVVNYLRDELRKVVPEVFDGRAVGR